MWGQGYGKAGDVEDAGAAQPLYPMMLERPELRWAFIRKVYSIVTVQVLLTVAVAAVVVNVRPVALFFVSSGAGLAVYILIILTPFIVLWPLYHYYQRHPVNFLLLGIFTVSLSFAVGLTCAFTSGKVILEAAILTSVVVVSLTLYTFWAARRGYDFSFLGPFLFGALLVLLVFGFIQHFNTMVCTSWWCGVHGFFLTRGLAAPTLVLLQLFFPLGRISVMIYGALVAIVFCAYIIYDTDNLIKRYSYDEYIWAAIQLYLDVINLFLALLQILRAANN